MGTDKVDNYRWEREPWDDPPPAEGDEWGTLNFWKKFTDKSPARPEKTWRNRFFWTWPISHYNMKRTTDSPRFVFGRMETSSGSMTPYVEIRLGRFKGETYKNIPLSNAVRINWWGWCWGWK